MNIFIPIVGQFSNVGDTLHRRILLDWLKDAGILHIYIGKAPASFISGLQLPANSILYRNVYSWLWKLMLSGYKKTDFVFNPGEMTFRKKRLFYELLLIPFLILTRLKKGSIMRIGVAAKSNTSINFPFLWRLCLSLTTAIYWRTNDSKERFGLGEVAPDLGFADDTHSLKGSLANDKRDLLIVSMRADRKEPSDNWISAIKAVAKRSNLTIKTLSQVKMDNSRTTKLGKKLSAEAVVWNDCFNHIEQEDRVRDIYAKAKIVLSDRLHVLIAAATEGCIPSCVLTARSDKVRHHFDVVGFEGVELLSEDYDTIVTFLEKQLIRGQELQSCITEAQSRLNEVKEKIKKNCYNN